MLGLVRWLVLLGILGRLVSHRYTRYTLAWAVAAWVAVTALQAAWRHWEYPNRNDGCAGHTSIDFGSSYMMGRMLVRGEGWYLYDRNHLRNVLREAYPREDEDPRERNEPGDAESFMSWIMGSDDREAAKTYASCLAPLAAPDGPSAALLLAAGRERAWTRDRLDAAAKHRVGGPLYPPINALVAAPLGLFRPLTAYHLRQYADFVLALLAALGVSVLTGGRVWAPVALAVLLVYPGYFGNLHLAQTSCLALVPLVWGWALVARGRPGLGGAAWGLLAFKPVWAMSFFMVLLLTRRWRACAAMLGAAAALALATLPFVGLHSWFDWLEVGREATFWYNIDKNWIHLSRDLLGIPRRFLLDFDVPYKERDRPEAAFVGWALLVSVAVLTVALALWRRKEARDVIGPRAAFLLLGAWMCCFHFMYYDVLLSFLPLMCLLANSHLYLRPRLWLRQALEWERRVLPGPRTGLDWPNGAGAAGPPGLSSGLPGSEHITANGSPAERSPALPLWLPRRVRAAAACAVAVFRFPPAPPRGPREVAVLRLPAHSPFGWIGLGNLVPVLALATLLFMEGPMRAWGWYDLYQPLDTYCLVVLWAWCGVAWAWRRRAATVAAPAAPREEAAARPADLLQASAGGTAVTPAHAP
jgi:hypothetical protein